MRPERRQLRQEALRILSGDGAILDVAREVSSVMRDCDIVGAVVGGVAVVLHGHVRTTVDVDVYCEDTTALAAALENAGFVFVPHRREFLRGEVPVHIVTFEQTGAGPSEFEELEGVRTVPLADLVNMKLRSGTRTVARAQDLADVVGLIRANALDGRFAARIAKDLRPEYRRLLDAVRREDG